MRRNDVNELIVRSAREEDLGVVEEMVSDFVKGHPAEKHPRSRAALRAAYFGDAPVANLIVASRRNRIVGMGQWTLIYDMFWGMYGANAEWLYVRPDSRGLGVAVAIIAEICAQVRRAGVSFCAVRPTTLKWHPCMSASQWVSQPESAMFRRKHFARSANSLAFRRGRSCAGYRPRT